MGRGEDGEGSGDGGVREKWLHSGYVLKVVQAGFTGALAYKVQADQRCEEQLQGFQLEGKFSITIS